MFSFIPKSRFHGSERNALRFVCWFNAPLSLTALPQRPAEDLEDRKALKVFVEQLIRQDPAWPASSRGSDSKHWEQELSRRMLTC